MKNNYLEMKERRSKIINDFPLGFAFSNDQFKDMMEKWGLKENDTDKIVSIDAGSFIRKEDLKEYNKMWDEIRKEHNDLIEQDKTGECYIKDMFVYELENHEYGYTRDITDTLFSLGITEEEITKNENLRNGLNLAIKEVLNNEESEM